MRIHAAMPDDTPAAAQVLNLNTGALLEEIDKKLREGWDSAEDGDYKPITAYPRGSRLVWGWIPDLEGKMALINIGHPWPYATAMTVIAMFQDETEVRVYTLPKQLPKEGEKLAPTRYTLTKAAPSIFSETMPLDTFKAELMTEYQILMGLDDDDDDDGDGDGDGETPTTPPNGSVTPAAKTETPVAS